jgi:hypothetical protein
MDTLRVDHTAIWDNPPGLGLYCSQQSTQYLILERLRYCTSLRVTRLDLTLIVMRVATC